MGQSGHSRKPLPAAVLRRRANIAPVAWFPSE